MIELKINYSSTMPLHQQIHDKILSDIRNGRFDKGANFPSIHELSKNFCVSIVTVSRAYRKLIRDGVLAHVKGQGYFVVFEL